MNNLLRLSTDIARSDPRRTISEPISARSLSFTPTIDHWVLQFHGIAAERLDDPDHLRTLLNEVVDALGLTRVSEHSHYFQPGVSTVIILSESHLSAHTWPEFGYMHVDIVTCVRKLTGPKLERAFEAVFEPERTELVQLDYTRQD